MRISRARPLLFGFAAIVSTILLPASAAFAKPFGVKPEPPWVKQFVVDLNGGNKDRPSSILLEDQQTKLSSTNVERFFRHVERINTTAGLERLSQLQFLFEPSYQSLTIHLIRIIRAGQTINAFEPAAVKIIQKEDDLDEQIYNGTLAAVLFLKDIRVGDVVDYSYTVTGDNPVFGGRFADRFFVGDREPIQNLRVRLLSPPNRNLSFRNQGVEITASTNSLGDQVEYLWERTAVPPVEIDDATPRWFEPVPSVWVSEFADWTSVVHWAAPLYQISQPLPAELKTKTEEWTRELSRPEDRMIAALRFIQQEIRYLGIELGPYSHQPSPPTRTLSRRFGDCKDKSFLLHATLRAMNIDSAIALVHASKGHVLDSYPPSPNAFDHVIVQARIGEKTYWLDATNESQRGSVDTYYDPFYERALVLRPETNGLEKIPERKLQSPTTEVLERYAVMGGGDRALLHVTSTYRGADADHIRYEWSQQSPDEMGKLYMNYYAEENPSIRSEGPPVIHDNEKENIVTVEEKYVIDSFWKNQWHYFNGGLAYFELTKPNISKRSMPLGVRHPVFLTQTVEIGSAAPPNLTPRSEVFANDAFRFEYKYEASASSTRLFYSLQTFQDFVSPEKVPAYLAQINQMWESTGIQLPQSSAAIVRAPGAPASEKSITITAAVVSVLLVGGVLAALKIRQRRRKPAFVVKASPGTTPESAVRCKQQNDIETYTRGFKCSCGSYPFTADALSHQEILFYDGERMATLKLKCGTCGRANDLYFVTPTATAD